MTQEEQDRLDAPKWEKLRAELSAPGSRTIFEGSAPIGRATKLYNSDGEFVVDGNEGAAYQYPDTAKLPEAECHYEALYNSPDDDDPERRAVARLRIAREVE